MLLPGPARCPPASRGGRQGRSEVALAARSGQRYGTRSTPPNRRRRELCPAERATPFLHSLHLASVTATLPHSSWSALRIWAFSCHRAGAWGGRRTARRDGEGYMRASGWVWDAAAASCASRLRTRQGVVAVGRIGGSCPLGPRRFLAGRRSGRDAAFHVKHRTVVALIARWERRPCSGPLSVVRGCARSTSPIGRRSAATGRRGARA